METFRVVDLSSKLYEMIQAPTSSQAAALYMNKHNSALVCVYDHTGKYTVYDKEATGVIDEPASKTHVSEYSEEDETS